jgi:hypothetical protein
MKVKLFKKLKHFLKAFKFFQKVLSFEQFMKALLKAYMTFTSFKSSPRKDFKTSKLLLKALKF